MPQDPSNGGFSTLDRPPTLPPEVQPSTFNQLAGQSDVGGGVSAGDMQIKGVVAQLGMNIEMLTTKLGQLVPGSESLVQQIVGLTRQLAVSALTGPSMPGQPATAQPAEPGMGGGSPFEQMAGPSQGPPMGMGGGY